MSNFAKWNFVWPPYLREEVGRPVLDEQLAASGGRHHAVLDLIAQTVGGRPHVPAGDDGRGGALVQADGRVVVQPVRTFFTLKNQNFYILMELKSTKNGLSQNVLYGKILVRFLPDL